MQNLSRTSKSPFTLLVLLALMVIATLVVISNYFLRPSMEMDLTKKITSNLIRSGLEGTSITVSGRDVTLEGSVKNQADAVKAERLIQENWDIRQLENKLVIKNPRIE
jgi:hypothetical protein